MGNIQTVGPNEALVVSGGCCRPSRRSIIVGGWCWNTWMLTNIQRLSLQIMTLHPKCEHVQSTHGVPVTVTGVVQCKILSSPEFLPLAAEQFLGKSVDYIRSVVLQTVEGHMRAVIGTQTIDDICRKRQDLASMIREATTKDLSLMGLDIFSLTIKDIKDDVEYLSSTGKRTAAKIKLDAAMETAKAESEAAQVEAECERELKEREVQNKTSLATQQHEIDMAEASVNESVGRIRAEATKAYDLQIACLQKDIRSIEMEVESVKFDGLIKIETKENERRKTELEMEVNLPTEAEVYQLQKQSEAAMKQLEAEVEAEEYRIKVEGMARAQAAQLEGEAEAEGMRLLAEARRKFNEAAILFEVLKVLPQVAAEIASPLSKFEEIVLISDGKNRSDSKSGQEKGKSLSALATEATRLSSSVPAAVRALGGSEQSGSNLLNYILQMQKSSG